jgi:hypothetical protein
MTLRDTLENLKNQDEQQKKMRENRPKVINEWKSAVSNLYEEITKYLSEYRGFGIGFKKEPVTVQDLDEELYEIDEFIINAPGRTLVISPGKGYPIGARGRLDIHLLGRSDNFPIIWTLAQENKPSLWIISSPPATLNDRKLKFGTNYFMPLDKESIESAIEFFLKQP